LPMCRTCLFHYTTLFRSFGGEDALVRPQIVSGTHAISTTLYSLLYPGDELLYITGSPYDTLEEVIGKRGNSAGSLKDYNILYNEDRKSTRLNSSHVSISY